MPVVIPLRDVDHAVAELEWAIDQRRQARSTCRPARPTARSPFDPYFDPFWARVNEAELRVAVHLGGWRLPAPTAATGARTPTPGTREYNAFQWVSYWSDRPIMETVTAMMFHNLFGRFPNVNVLIAEFGTVVAALPAAQAGPRHAAGPPAQVGHAAWPPDPASSSEHFVIAPFPEENVAQAIEVVGTDCLIFGSDFPHSEGSPTRCSTSPSSRASTTSPSSKIMRDNLERFITA